MEFTKEYYEKAGWIIIDKFECGCYILGASYDYKTPTVLIYCPLHKSAANLYEACKLALNSPWANVDREQAQSALRKALAKAEGKNG